MNIFNKVIYKWLYFHPEQLNLYLQMNIPSLWQKDVVYLALVVSNRLNN